MKKKNGAHTHVRTTVQLDEWNIHVGCCLFSHKKNTKELIATSVMLKKTALALVHFGIINKEDKKK